MCFTPSAQVPRQCFYTPSACLGCSSSECTGCPRRQHRSQRAQQRQVVRGEACVVPRGPFRLAQLLAAPLPCLAAQRCCRLEVLDLTRALLCDRPIFVLQIKAELEGVASFRVPPESVLEIDVKQSGGDDERKGVQIDPEESHEVPNSKNATANFMVKFEGDKAPSTLSMVSLKGLPFRAQTADDTGMVPIAAFECRGMEPTKWHPTGYYEVEALSGTVYDQVGFKDGEDWCEYDEKSGESMMARLHVEETREPLEASGIRPPARPNQCQTKLRARPALGSRRTCSSGPSRLVPAACTCARAHAHAHAHARARAHAHLQAHGSIFHTQVSYEIPHEFVLADKKWLK